MKVTFYIPSRRKDGRVLYGTQKDVVEMVAGLFSVKFGGATAVESIGYWVDAEKSLAKEKVILVYSFFDEVEAGYFEGLASDLKKAMKQESFLYTIDDTPFFC